MVFSKAVALYNIHSRRIEMLQTPMILEYKAKLSGGRAAIRISYTILTITACIVFARFLRI